MITNNIGLPHSPWETASRLAIIATFNEPGAKLPKDQHVEIPCLRDTPTSLLVGSAGCGLCPTASAWYFLYAWQYWLGGWLKVLFGCHWSFLPVLAMFALFGFNWFLMTSVVDYWIFVGTCWALARFLAACFQLLILITFHKPLMLYLLLTVHELANHLPTTYRTNIFARN